MDRRSVGRNISSGLAASGIALFVFALAFFVSILYIA